MSPLLVATTTALLLACVHLSIGASIVSVPGHMDSTIERTATEAIHAKMEASNYLKSVELPEACNINLTYSFHDHVPGCNSTNISRTLNHLMYMYSSILGHPSEQRVSDTDEALLDFLEMTFFRFSSQMERYFQVKDCIVQSVNKREIQEEIEALQRAGCTRMELLNKIIGYFKELASGTVQLREFENFSIYSYKFCDSAKNLNCWPMQE